ncbi:MAG: nucleotide exchange factor GrpE [Elusimicrobiota bacterium]
MFDSKDKEINSIYEAARDEKMGELEILKQSLEEKKKLAEEYYNQLLRLKADFENFRKRTEKEKQSHLNWGKEEILLKQIDLLDVLDQAVESIKSSDNIESIKQGLTLMQQEFVKMLSSEGVKEVGVSGGRFDPAVYEAIEKVESDQPEDTVVEVVRKGYSFNTRVIRPAKVKVSKQKETNTENTN